MPLGAPPHPRHGVARARVAQAALALCAQVDALGRQVETALAQEELPPLQPLLVRRDQLLQQLAGHVAELRRTAPGRARPLSGSGVPDGELDGQGHGDAADAADPQMDAVLAAVERTSAEAARVEAVVAAQVAALRGELDAMQRAAAAPDPYGGAAARGEGRRTPAWGVGVPPSADTASRINTQG